MPANDMSSVDDLVNSFLVELKRGTLTLVVLSQLQEPQYGYSLLQNLEEKRVAIEAGTLYPLLRRLEKQGLLRSEWDTKESRPRKYYALSEHGLEVFQRLRCEWEGLSIQMNDILKGARANGAY